MNNKVLYIIIAALLLALALQTGYLIGKGRSERTPGGILQKTDQAKSDRSSFSDRNLRIRPVAANISTNDSYLSEWDPFSEMSRMQKMMNRMFNDSFGRAVRMDNPDSFGMNLSFDPAVDLRDLGDSYLVTVDLPGVDKDTINISAQADSLTISGERSVEKEKKDDNGMFYSAERSYGSFKRTIPLPEKIIPQQVTAEASDGVLAVKLPKEAPSKGNLTEPMTIKVR